MTTTDPPDRARAQPFVGREAERISLRHLVEDEDQWVVFIHGLAGMGKSSLLRVCADEAAEHEVPVFSLDGEDVEPTPRGFLESLSSVLGGGPATTDAVARRFGEMGRRVLLTIDAYERLRLLDDWLRRELIPALPANVRVAIAGRDAPVAAWRSRYGPLLATLELEPLAAPAALELLRRLGVPRAAAVEVNRSLRGHPLSLHLAAMSPAALTPAESAVPAFRELARTYLDDLPADLRAALDAACVVRRVTIPLLDAILRRPSAHDFEELRRLPFAALGADGLTVHDVVRQAVASELRAIDPPRYRTLRVRAWRELRRQLDASGEGDLWRYSADMLYLLERPAVRDAFFPTDAPRYSVEAARSADGAAIAAIAKRHEPGAGAAIQQAWWRDSPRAFFVARDAAGDVAAFSAVIEAADLGKRLWTTDPVAAAWRRDLHRKAIRRGETALLIRYMCGAENGERPAPETAALYLDLKRTYLALRPRLRRLYTCAHQVEAMGPTLEPLGFEPLRGPATRVADVEYVTYCNDLGPRSVDGWLTRLAERDVLGADHDVLDDARRRLVVDGTAVDLTPLEFGVVRQLRDRDGAVVRREVLLEEVWGGRWNGDGNALEAVVSGVRRKLGDRASALETVRGVGYRLGPLD